MREKRIPKYELEAVNEDTIKKYNLPTDGDFEWYQLVALRAFGNVEEGDKGGFVSHTFLSQSGTCWIEEGSIAMFCTVTGNAVIKKHSILADIAIGDNAIVSNSSIYGSEATTKNSIKIKGTSKIIDCEKIEVTSSLAMDGESRIEGIPYIRVDSLKVSGDTQIGKRGKE